MARLGDTDSVEVLAADLRLIDRALEAAYVTQAAWDLIDQQRQMGSQQRESNGTRAVQKARDRVRGYIAEAEEDEKLEGEPSDVDVQ